MKVSAATLLFALTLVCSCDRVSIPSGYVTDRRILPNVKAGDMTKAGGIQGLSDLERDGFNLDIIADEPYNEDTTPAGKYGATRTVTKEGSVWKISPDAFWINETQMSFWAYNNAVASDCVLNTIVPNAGLMSFSYPKSTVTPDGQTDLLLAYNSKTHDESDHHAQGTADKDEIDLDFYHAMSKIAFTKGTFTGVDGYEVSKITLIDLKSSGDASFDGSVFGWTNLSDPQSFSIDNLSKFFLVIPQNASAATIQLTLSKPAAEDKVLSTSLADYLMKAGKTYTYELNVNDGKDLALSMTVAPWDLQDRVLEIKDSQVTAYLNKDSYAGGVEDADESKIFIHNDMPITGSFTLTSPIGAKLLLALDGNLDAFRVEPKICHIDGNPVNFTITPLVHDPKIDYQTRLHIYLVGSDGSVSELDQQIMKEGSPLTYKHYTIILPAQ